MEFPTEAAKNCFERLTPMIKEVFGEFATANPDYPVYTLAMGSAYIQVGVYPWADDDAAVRIWSYVITGVENTADLMKYLLTQNANMILGAFALDEDGDIVLQYCLPGLSCTKDELKLAAMSIIYTADRVDDEIMAKFGGQRAIDRAPK